MLFAAGSIIFVIFKFYQIILKRALYILCLFFLLTGCGEENKVDNGHEIKAEHVIEKDDPAFAETAEDVVSDRTSWQKPEIIVGLMGDLSGKTVADIGAGTGYFSFRMIHDAAKVIAIDIDTSMIQLIEAFKSTMSESLQEKLETRLALPDDPLLKKGEADIYLIVNTVAYLNRPQYFAKLHSLMKPGDILMIVDYKVRRLPIEAPPYDERVLVHLLESDLYDAGFQQVYADDTSLDFQYVVVGGI